MKVLMVCTGNLCRSPMAEALFREAVAARGCDIEVTSVGTWAYDGSPAMHEAVEALRNRDIDLGGHRSRAADAAEIRAADVVVVMTSVHKKEVSNLVPEAAEKVVLIKELVELGLTGELPDRAERRLERLLRAQRPQWRRALDLDDPIGKPLPAYERTVAELEIGIGVLLDALCPGAGGKAAAPA